MRLVDDFPFYAELTAPVHNRLLRDAQAEPTAEEVVLDEAWGIELQDHSPQAEQAAADLREFLQGAMGIKVAEGPGTQGSVVLAVDESLRDAGPEAHRVVVEAGRVSLIGATARALIPAVVFIEDLMRSRRAPYLPLGTRKRKPLFTQRIHRSCLSPFYVEELTGLHGEPFSAAGAMKPLRYTGWQHEDAGPDAFYHDNILRRLMHHGMNGIWIRGALCRFARVSIFDGFGEHAEKIMAELARLCDRAARFGIRVFLYFNEPLGLPAEDPFWEKYPEAKGYRNTYHGTHYMCTSIPAVKEFLREGMAYIFNKVPELGGVILISASEYPTHCYSHVPTRPGSPPKQELVARGVLCERCAEREPQEVVAEVITLIRDGVKAGNPDADVIAWNWSWSMYEEDPQEGILRRLPPDVVVMGDFERGIKTQALGFEYQHDEYSLKIIGPSDRFRKMAASVQGRDGRVFAKIQIGTTHEDGNVPYLPVLERLAAKYEALRAQGVEGLMTCWNFGNNPSLATELAGMMSWSDAPEEVDDALRELAARHFGPAAAPTVAQAWKALSAAMEDFPSSIPVMYHGPVNRGLAFPLSLQKLNKPFPRSWLLDLDDEGDDLESWTKPFGPEHVLRCFRVLTERFSQGAQEMLSALPQTQGSDTEALKREAGVAQICAHQFRSAANITEFILVRNRWLETEDEAEKDELRQRMVTVLEDEQKNASQALELVDADPQLGFHGEAYGYLFNRPLIEAKLERLEEILAELMG